MSEKTKAVKEAEKADFDQYTNKTVSYIRQNKRSLAIIGGAIVVILVGFYGYLKLYKQPLEAEAKNVMWKAEYYFRVDSFNLAINGDGTNPGFLQIADEYSGTEAGDLALYYLGVCYLNTGQYEAAIENFESTDLEDDILSVMAIGQCGDAYIELGNIDEAIAKYEEAIEKNENGFTTPLYLKKAALAYEDKNDFAKAAEYYQRIYDEYESSAEGDDIQKYLVRAKSIAGK
ncbi:MAG: tetratricopeptide repeat protein [Bacteroidota bacterium]